MKLLLAKIKYFLFFSCPVFLFFVGSLNAQTESFSVKDNTGKNQLYISNDGKVGIDTSATLGTLTINGNDGIIAIGKYGSGTTLNLGAGTRFMWYPNKAALRAGYVNQTQWDYSNIGTYSIAMGLNTIASGSTSTALGDNTTSSGYISTAMGHYTTASGDYSTAMGYHITASGNYSTAMGYYAISSGSTSTALGDNTTSSGDYSTAMGYHTTASGNYSTAMGCNVNSIFTGAFVIGDATTTSLLYSSADNQFSARFTGGYYLYTNSALTIGAKLLAGSNAWSTISDSTKKENFLPVNGENVLQKIKTFNLRSWNYKGQNPKQYRHYGPMAQEFFNAFGHDKYGAIGNDTTINSADFDGINLIAIQALEKRTDELKNANKKIVVLENEISAIKEKTANQDITIKEQNKIILKLKEQFSSLQQTVNVLLKQSKNTRDKNLELTVNSSLSDDSH